MKEKDLEIIIKELSSRFNKKQKLISCMLQIFIDDNFTIEESKKYIIEFFKIKILIDNNNVNHLSTVNKI